MTGPMRMLRRLRSDDSGLSMAELLVAGLLTSIIMVMVSSFFIQTTKLTTAAAESSASNGAASNVVNGITSVLRVATTLAKSSSEIPESALVSGTRSSLTLYSLADTTASNPAPVKVTFTLDATGQVTESRCTGTTSAGFWSFGSCTASSTRVLGTGVLAPTGTDDQLFTYRDGSGAPMLIGTGALTATQRAAVSSIVVTVRLQAPASTREPVVIRNTVVMHNLGLESVS